MAERKFKTALINCHHEGMEWVGKFLPGENPYLLPVVNKPLLEYMLDYCLMCGVSEVVVIDSEYDVRVGEFLGAGEKWNLEIDYVGDRTERDFRAGLKRHHQTVGAGPETRVLVFNGLFLPHYDQRALVFPEMLLHLDVEEKSGPADGLGALEAGRLFRLDCRISPIDGILAYYRLNMRILEHECDCFCIPGYKIENGIYTGMNVTFPPGCAIEAPAVLGNSVALGAGCRLKSVVIGDNVIADSRSEITRSVVLGNTYLGADLEFCDKIVVHNHVTDPFSGTAVNLFDAQLAGELRFHGGSRLFNSLLSRCGALLLGTAMLLPWLLFLLWGVRSRGKGAFFAFSHLGKTDRIELRKIFYSKYPELIDFRKYRYFRALSLDKFVLLYEVFFGNLALVGDYLYDANDPWTEVFIRRNYAKYRAGVFSISELTAGDVSPAARLIDDLYLGHNRSIRLEFFIILRCLIARLFRNYGESHP